jgi:sulfofructosephosphate aldolase
MTHDGRVDTIDSLRDTRGNFSMLAIDQRESLRGMLGRARPTRKIENDELVEFKLAAARELTPYASAVLLDRSYGAPAARASKCPIILAADILHSDVPGGAVNRAELDRDITADVVADFGAVALKMLVPWLPGARSAAIELAAEFMELCNRLGLLGIVEGVIRPADFDSWTDNEKNEALVEAAQGLGSTEPHLYKAEVPLFGAGDPDSIMQTAARITAAVDCPWVVLSSGVRAEDFPKAVALSMAGGASGFLAGRALWADATIAADPVEFLRVESARRLQQLSAGLAPPFAPQP